MLRRFFMRVSGREKTSYGNQYFLHIIALSAEMTVDE